MEVMKPVALALLLYVTREVAQRSNLTITAERYSRRVMGRTWRSRQ
jgi:hypothetical protein